MSWKSILKPEGSVIAGAATIGLVYGVYQMNIGNVSQCHASTENHPSLESSRKKAGWTALVMVAGLTLITRDANIGILGTGTIIAMELSYRHAIMANPQSGIMQRPFANNFEPAENVVPFAYQGQPT